MFKHMLALALACSLVVVGKAPSQAAQGTGCLPTTGTVSGLSLVQSVNAAIAALISGNSGASPPQTDCSAAPVKGQVWLDTSVTPNVEKRFDGTNWVVVGAIDAVNHVWAPPVGGGTATITAAATTDVCANPSALQTIVGTTTITSFGTNCPVGVRKTLLFSNATPITYNATSLILPALRNYTTAAGDMADAIYLGTGNWRIKEISKIDGSSVTNPAVALGSVVFGDYASGIPAKQVAGLGQALTRAAYPDYFLAVTRLQTGTLTSGGNVVTSVANTAGLGPGMPVEGTGIPLGATIVSVTSTTINLSANATVSGAQSFRVFPTGYGSGGDSTTVGVKNCMGRSLAGADPFGSNLTGAAALNTPLGSPTAPINRVNLPNVAIPVAVSGTVTVTTNPNQLLASNSQVSGFSSSSSGGPPFNAFPAGSSQVVGYQTSTGSNSMTGATDALGSSVPISIVPPVVTAECTVVVLP